ncbi:MAG: hypothetical protein H0W72_02285 [Planctomycetes bacterium]|nr:hypothetical protein [Planctomycetota bacterium]
MASAKYVARVEWDGAALFPVPAGHTRELETDANRAQANDDILAARDAGIPAAQAGLRERARAFLVNDPRPEMKALRALALVVLDEINRLSQDPTSVLPTRTTAQLLNAVVAKIIDGSAD